MNDPLRDYYRTATEAEVEMAEAYQSQGRKARAQEALQEARFWFMKCNCDDLRPLQNRITNLEKTLY
jgi:hypothetical protein